MRRQMMRRPGRPFSEQLPVLAVTELTDRGISAGETIVGTVEVAEPRLGHRSSSGRAPGGKSGRARPYAFSIRRSGKDGARRDVECARDFNEVDVVYREVKAGMICCRATQVRE